MPNGYHPEKLRYEVEVIEYHYIEAESQADAEKIANDRWGDDVHDVRCDPEFELDED